MKKAIATSSALLIAIGSIAAASPVDTPSSTKRIQRYVSGSVDVSQLSVQQKLVILQLISSSDGEGEARQRVRAYLIPDSYKH